MSIRILYVCIIYSVCDLMCDVISCCVLSCDMGKINVQDKIVIENQKKGENAEIIFFHKSICKTD